MICPASQSQTISHLAVSSLHKGFFMLGTLPKLAGKAFVPGFLLPAFLFLVSVIALFSDLNTTKDLLAKLAQKNVLETVAYLARFSDGDWPY